MAATDLTEAWQVGLCRLIPGINEAPADGAVYGRNGLTTSWQQLDLDFRHRRSTSGDGNLYVRNGFTQSWTSFPDQSGDFVTLGSPPQSISTMRPLAVV